MFKKRFLQLISNDFGVNGSDFLTASLPTHIKDSTSRLIKNIGDDVYKEALMQPPQVVTSVTKVDDFTINIGIKNTNVFNVGDYVIFEGNENYGNYEFVTEIISPTLMKVSTSSYSGDISNLSVLTKLRHDVELAGAYFTAYDLLPTLMQISEDSSIVEGGSIGQGSWRLGDINKRRYYLNRAMEIVATLTNTTDPNDLKSDLL
jgi:hypothetical protein